MKFSRHAYIYRYRRNRTHYNTAFAGIVITSVIVVISDLLTDYMVLANVYISYRPPCDLALVKTLSTSCSS